MRQEPEWDLNFKPCCYLLFDAREDGSHEDLPFKKSAEDLGCNLANAAALEEVYQRALVALEDSANVPSVQKGVLQKLVAQLSALFHSAQASGDVQYIPVGHFTFPAPHAEFVDCKRTSDALGNFWKLCTPPVGTPAVYLS